eukprot:161174-Rhodomonas_salina.2
MRGCSPQTGRICRKPEPRQPARPSPCAASCRRRSSCPSRTCSPSPPCRPGTPPPPPRAATCTAACRECSRTASARRSWTSSGRWPAPRTRAGA